MANIDPWQKLAELQRARWPVWSLGGSELRSVPHYRIYPLNPDGHIAGPPYVVECADDQEAVAKAAFAVRGKDAALWECDRIIARFPSVDPK